ncbi:MAG: hypothetical protein JEZ07_02510 [Phycisphaerae bacterium]|nr:hypothetical protein [Phycisphaerae bacterium]
MSLIPLAITNYQLPVLQGGPCPRCRMSIVLDTTAETLHATSLHTDGCLSDNTGQLQYQHLLANKQLVAVAPS